MRVEELKPYGVGEKTKQIERTFDTIAQKYDRLNRILSVGTDKSWRRKALRLIAQPMPKTLLDVATGTGDFAILASRVFHECKITGVDLSANMLEIAKEKSKESMRFLQADVMSWETDERFDAVTCAFGVRNFCNISQGIKALTKLLYPGGRLLVLELSRPENKIIAGLHRMYLRWWMPFVGKVLTGCTDEYKYLPESVQLVPQGEAMLAMFRDAGLTDLRVEQYTFGACSAYVGTKTQST